MKIDGSYTPEQINEMKALELDAAAGPVITYNAMSEVNLSTGWTKVFLLPHNITTLAARMDRINED